MNSSDVIRPQDDNPEWTNEDFARARPAPEMIGVKAAALLVRKARKPRQQRR